MEQPLFDDDLDAIDAQDIEAMMASRGWKLYAERLAACLEDAQLDCERPSPEVMFHQGRCRGLRTASELPAAMIAEAKENAQRKSRRA